MKKEITIVLFDLDNTLYKHDTEGQWLKHLIDLGVLDKKENNKKIKYFDEEYVKGRLKIDKYFDYVLHPLTQHKKSTLHRWRKDFIKKRIKPKISKKAHSLVSKHKKLKHKLIMVTAAYSFVAEPIAQFFGMHHMIASKVIEKKGQYTNKTEKILKISKKDAFRQYIAYHEGWGNYKNYEKKQKVILLAKKVQQQADKYRMQLKQCQKKLNRNKYIIF